MADKAQVKLAGRPPRRAAPDTRRGRTISVENSAKPAKRQPRGKPFAPGNPHAFPPGVSGNPGGRPKVLSDAYRAALAAVDPQTGKTQAELIAEAQVREAQQGDVAAAREIRSATEGERQSVTLVDWRSEALAGIRDGTLTAAMCRDGLRLSEGEIEALFREAGVKEEGKKQDEQDGK